MRYNNQITEPGRNKIMTRYGTAAALAILTLLAASQAALALSAQATAPLNIRSGPGASYEVVGVLGNAERVEVESCRNNGWCRITYPGGEGWVSSHYLVEAGFHKNWSARSRIDPPSADKGRTFFERFIAPNLDIQVDASKYDN